jgi:hypothetical protein
MRQENRRVYAADWFIRAAAMPCSLVLAALTADDPPGSVHKFLLQFLLIVAGPAVIAGGWGAVLGAAILEPAVTRSAANAGLRGAAVALVSFVTYLFVVCAGLAALDLDHAGDFLKLFLVLLIYGTILFIWLVVALGALAGVLLYKKAEGERVSAGGGV